MHLKNILYVVPERLGDAVMTTPIVELLKQYQPDTKISIFALSPLAASVYENNPLIEKIYTKQITPASLELGKNFDACMISHINENGLESAEKLGIPILRDSAADQTKTQADQGMAFIHLLYDHTLPTQKLAYTLFPAETHTKSIIAKLNAPQGALLVGLHIGCHGIAKMNFFRKLVGARKTQHRKLWPLQNFVALAQLIQKKHPNAYFVLTGGEPEKHLADAFEAQVPQTLNLCGKTNTLELAALMKQLRCYVSSDTGAMHVACAMNVPLIALFGPTNAIRTGPYPEAKHRQVISGKDMLEVTPEEVAQAVETWLN